MKINSRETGQFSVPLVDLRRQYKSIQKDIERAIADVIEKGRFILGENVEKFEREFANYCGVKYTIGEGSGMDALNLSLKALELKERSEVITVSHTFVASVNCIVNNNLTPVFVDVNSSYTMDVTQIEPLITDKTKAIIVVHLYGHPVNMQALEEVASKHNLIIIEDAAQAHGAEYKNKKIGGFGTCGCFSFYPSKNLGAYGNAGIITTNDKELEHKLRMLTDYGRKEKYVHEIVSSHSDMDELQAAVLRVKLRHLDNWNEKRRKHAKMYTELLSNVKELILPNEENDAKHVYHLYVIRAKKREELRKWLTSKGIGTGIHYPIPIHMQKAYASVTFRKGNLANTEKICQEILSLPMYPELEEYEINYITDCINEFYSTNT